MVVVFELSMKLRWLGLHTFIRHRRTMVKVICPSPYSIFSRVTFQPVSSVQFQIPPRSEGEPRVPTLTVLPTEVRLMPTVANTTGVWDVLIAAQEPS